MITRRTAIFSRLPIDNRNARIEGEIRLWRAFLDQMLIDTFSNKKEEESIDWLYDREGKFYPDFYKVCELAMLEPQWVEDVIKHLEEGHMPEFTGVEDE